MLPGTLMGIFKICIVKKRKCYASDKLGNIQMSLILKYDTSTMPLARGQNSRFRLATHTGISLYLRVVSKTASIISRCQVRARHFHRLTLLKVLVRDTRNNVLLLRKIHGVPSDIRNTAFSLQRGQLLKLN